MARSFNSRSRVGSNAPVANKIARALGFNSRSRVGSNFVHSLNGSFGKVSIRAPAWGATQNSKPLSTNSSFQFALPRGEQRILIQRKVDFGRFQFALPRGEQPLLSARKTMQTWFQFALPRGEQQSLEDFDRAWIEVSIRAPAWGATSAPGGGISMGAVSIRAPAWGATTRWRRP